MVSGVRCPVYGVQSPAVTINAVVFDRPVPVCLSVCSKTAEVTTFKFGERVLRDSPNMTLTNISPKVGVVTVLELLAFKAPKFMGVT